jgi:hypothetical protein
MQSRPFSIYWFDLLKRIINMSRLIAGFLVCSFVFTLGCGEGGPKLYPVTGTVKVDGSPKPKLLVTFTPNGGGPIAVGQTNEKGEYSLRTNSRKGAVEGQHTVSITTMKEATEEPKVQSSAPSGSADYMNQANIRPQEFKIPKEPIPAKYNKNSELVRDVDSSTKALDFDISTKE